jgi:diguanylate cyclase (GGDEF)-like protein
VPLELTIIAVTALLAGLLLVGIMLAGRGVPATLGTGESNALREVRRRSETTATGSSGADATLRVVWWLTITIVLLGVGISGSFATDQAPIFVLGGAAVLAVVIFHELIPGSIRGRWVHLAELVVAIALIGGLLALTGYASSPFAMLFALVSVSAALAYGPRAGLAAAGLATVAFAIVLLIDPSLSTYGPEDALRLSVGLVATWLLAFVAVAYSARQRHAMEGVIELWRTDPLTGLFNRSQLFVTLEQEVSRTRRSDRGFCVLMMDLDGLKAINDSGGHLRGDEVLRAIGAVIQGSIRAVDSAYRYGGDEFVVLLPETDIVGAFVVAEKIRAGAEELGAALEGGEEPITSVSIGLVSHPEDGMGAEELIASADRAMYQAKKLGKNQISGNPRPRPPLLARRSVVEADQPIAAAEAPAVTPPPATDAAAESGPIPAAAAESGPKLVPTMGEPAPPAAAGRNGGMAPHEHRAVAVELGPIVSARDSRPVTGPRPEVDDAEADPRVVREQIAAASLSFDPDHQIRRAMDAFLSPGSGSGERDRSTPDQ